MQPEATVAGLPGRNIRPGQAYQQQAYRQQNVTPADATPSRRSPLGISIDTNVQPINTAPPKRIYPHTAGGPANHVSQSATKKQKPSLKLGKEISPFDREIPICCSPKTLSGTPGPLTGQRLSSQSIKTPCIIITPVEEDFGQSSPLPRRHDISRHQAGLSPNAPHFPRVASSVYSPLKTSRRSRRLGGASRSRSASDCTIIEDEGDDTTAPTRATRKSSLDSVLPTPRRSVGWWNLIASPLPRRSSSASSQQSKRMKDEDEEQTPLLEKFADFGDSGERDLARLDDPATRRNVEESHFHHYRPPMTGQAANYYDSSFDLYTPLDETSPPTISSPEAASSIRSMINLSPVETHDERGMSLAMPSEEAFRNASKQVPMPTMPTERPPQSASASVMGRFQTPAVRQRGGDSAASTPPAPPAASPFSPSPIIGTAQVEYFQTVKTQRESPSIQGSPARAPAPNVQQASPRYFDDSPSLSGSSYNQPPRQQLFTPAQRQSSAAPSFLAPSSVHASTIHRSPQDSMRRLASPFETPSQQHQSRPPLHTFAEKDFDRSEWHKQEVGIERVRRPKSRKCFAAIKTRWLLIAICLFFMSLVVLAIVLAMMLAITHDAMPVAVSWLNLTDFPPIPTGISTVAQPDIVKSASDCVQQTNMWSCALPKEEQTVAPNNGPAPSFRLEIMFSPDTVYTLPDLPDMNEQVFLGNTTDNITAPFAGEATPFYISILPTTVLGNSSHITKRSVSSNSSTLHNSIPPPNLISNGSSAPAQLYPFPVAQPLRLLNRGLDTEHYGFYTYFARSIFLASPSLNSTDNFGTNDTANGLNINGGAPVNAANSVCTFSQTRFHVQIWTHMTHPLISSSSGNKFSTSDNGYVPPSTTSTNNTSAFDFDTPGSFPYPITISLDRHGGAAKQKGVYCYGIDTEGRVVSAQKTLVQEDRASGGTLVNPAMAPFTAMEDDQDQGGDASGGIDGGTGGCDCRWQNFGG